jgi:hypothetical protein
VLENASFKEAGVIFQGLGIEGGVPLKDLKIDADFPIFNTGTSHKKRSNKDYCIKSKEAGLTPYEYTLDVVRGRLTLTNTIPITDYVKLDVEKYTKEQQSVIVAPLHRALEQQTDEQQADEEANRKDRKDAIKAVIEKYDRDLEVVTPARKHQLTEYCTLEK